MSGHKKNVLTQKQSLEEPVGSYHHPTEETWRSGACKIGTQLRKGYYRKGYTTKTGKTVPGMYINTSCTKSSIDGKKIQKKTIPNNKFRKEVLTEKQALKNPLGSYYHPTEETWRSGACPIGKILKKGYEKKSYTTKTGKKIEKTYINPTCVINKGNNGITKMKEPKMKEPKMKEPKMKIYKMKEPKMKISKMKEPKINIEKVISNKNKPNKLNNISKLYSKTLTENNIIENITNNMILELIKKK